MQQDQQPRHAGQEPGARHPLSPQEAARRRKKRAQRKKALRRYHIFLVGLALLAVALVAGLFFLLRGLLSDGEGNAKAPPASVPASSSAPPASSAVPEPEPEPEPDPNVPADPTLWSLLLTNVSHPLPEGYAPELASVGSNSRNGEQFMDERVADAMLQMVAAAKSDGIDLAVRSAYRSTREQASLFNSMKQSYLNQGLSEEQALAETKKWRNVPGTSEHETGLCADIVGAADINADLVPALSEREWAKWLKEHAADYGFILRYPEGKTDVTGTSFEPWHYRYVGVEDAQKITAQGVCLEEYLGRTE